MSSSTSSSSSFSSIDWSLSPNADVRDSTMSSGNILPLRSIFFRQGMFSPAEPYAFSIALPPIRPHSFVAKLSSSIIALDFVSGLPLSSSESTSSLAPSSAPSKAFAMVFTPRLVSSFSSRSRTFSVSFSSINSATDFAPWRVISFPLISRCSMGESELQIARQTIPVPSSSRRQSRKLRYFRLLQRPSAVPRLFAPSGPKELSARSRRSIFFTFSSPIPSKIDAMSALPSDPARVPEKRTSVSRPVQRLKIRAKALHPSSPDMLLKK
mmetsp:Transcript_18890/g.25988  ORF Transcript_18890/g.25988 Transcript_18890/m.25988 type:complete len:268 (-) Transcript_18890:692-1495(-)